MKPLWLFPLLLPIILISCQSEDLPAPDPTPDPEIPEEQWTFSMGKNSYQVEVDGQIRNVHVHVPNSYQAGTPTPVVFMFHGSGGSGNNVYQTSGWTQKADAAGFIGIFPTAREYFVVELGQMQTKWSAGGLDTELEVGTEIIDDIPFVESLLTYVRNTFTVDEQRIFASGFSNGGGFTKSRIMAELSDQFAAVATAGGHALPQASPILSGDILPIHTIMGNVDNKKLALAGQTEPFPMDATDIMAHDYLRGDIDVLCGMLNIDPTLFTSEPVEPHWNTLYFQETTDSGSQEYRFRMVKDMGHIWPNGNNHASGLSAPEVFWDFFLQHPKD